MLKSVLYGAERDCVRNVHWLHALAAATSIVWSAPRSSSAAKSTAEDTDIVDPLDASGRLTFNAEVSEEQLRRNAKRTGLWSECGRKTASVMLPAARTAPTNSRAAVGRSFTGLPPEELDARENMPPGAVG